MKKNWYLLKSRRYEGPFQIEDLNVRAQQGLLSPDDYLISEEDFSKGQMVYKKAAQILPKDCFRVKLSAPVLPIPSSQQSSVSSSSPQASVQSSATREIQVKESYKTVSIQKPNLEESVSPVSEWFAKINFANAVTACVVVMAAVWFFDASQNQGGTRQPAEAADTQNAVKRNVQREVVRDYRASQVPESEVPRPQRLMPSQRPARNVASQPPQVNRMAPTARPAVQALPRGRGVPAPSFEQAPSEIEDFMGRDTASEDPNGIHPDDRPLNREIQSEDAQDWQPDDTGLSPDLMMHPEYAEPIPLTDEDFY